MTYTYALKDGRFMIIPSRTEASRYCLIWEDPDNGTLTLLRDADGVTAFQAVITQETGFKIWDERDVHDIPAEIYDFSLWATHRCFSEDRSQLPQAV